MQRTTPLKILRPLQDLVIVAAATTAPLAAAWDWIYLAPLVDRADALANSFDIAPNGVVWLAHGAGTYRLPPAGSPQLQRVGAGLPGVIVAMPDGGAAQRDFLGVMRFGADGRFLWRQNLDPRNTPLWIVPNNDGSVWTLDHAQLLRLGPDGSVLASVSYRIDDYPNSLPPVAVDPVDDSLHLSTMVAGNSRIYKYDRGGSQLRAYNATGTVDLLRLGANRGVVLAGRAAAEQQLAIAPQFTRLDRGGNLLNTYVIDGAKTTDFIDNFLVMANGEVYFLDAERGKCSQRELMRVDATGHRMWSYEPAFQLDCSARTASTPPTFLAVAADGTVNLAGGDDVPFVSLDANGQLLAQTELHLFGNPRQLADLSYVGQSTSRATFQLDIVHFDAKGAALTDAYAPHDLPESAATLAAAFDNAGNSYLLDDRGFLTAVNASGARQWRTALPVQNLIGQAAIVVGSDRICASAMQRVVSSSGVFIPYVYREQIACLARNDGSVFWHLDLPGPSSDFEPPNDPNAAQGLHLFDDGRVLAIFPHFGGSKRLLVAANGALLSEAVALGRLDRVAFNGAGAAATLNNDASDSQPPTFDVFEADGSLAYSLESPIKIVSNLQMDDAGNLYAAGIVRTQPTLSRVIALGPDGAARWSYDLPTDGSAHLLLGAGKLFISQGDNPQTHAIGTRRQYAMAVSAQTGVQAWKRSFDSTQGAAGFLGLGNEGNLLHLLTDADTKLSWNALDAASGNVMSSEFRDCAADHCSLVGIAAGANSSLRAAVATPYSAIGTASILGGTSASTKLAKIDQHALGGTWWAPYSGGQGFMLDYLPATHTFFMPWFTFTSAGGVDPAQQRWYTIQGTVAGGPTTAQIGIYDSRNGAFDANDATSVNHVGDASITFTDCDHANLHYQFLAPFNEAREGDITLSRLLPRREACVLADGSAAPAPAATAPQGGFDSKLSGSWYEPATAGQGIQFDVQPGGILFAAWFTYDPASLGDDETKQHWMTLQGSLANAQNGVATVAIAQAIGGSFDNAVTYDQYVMGSAKITVQDCSHMRLDYQFDDTESAGSYRRRSGSIALQKIGGCTP